MREKNRLSSVTVDGVAFTLHLKLTAQMDRNMLCERVNAPRWEPGVVEIVRKAVAGCALVPLVALREHLSTPRVPGQSAALLQLYHSCAVQRSRPQQQRCRISATVGSDLRQRRGWRRQRPQSNGYRVRAAPKAIRLRQP